MTKGSRFRAFETVLGIIRFALMRDIDLLLALHKLEAMLHVREVHAVS